MTVEDVFYNYGSRVYNIARRLVGNDTDAEDVTQDVLLQVIRKLETFRGDSRLDTWLYRVTVNAALMHCRKQSNQRKGQTPFPSNLLQEIDTVAILESKAPDEQAMQKELQELIALAIARLPKIYRDVVILADIEDLSNAEIGDLLRIGLTAVKSRLHRGRMMMRTSLARHMMEEE